VAGTPAWSCFARLRFAAEIAALLPSLCDTSP
jgi:hypothetical protein